MTLFFDVENLGYAHLFLFVYMDVRSCSHKHTHTRTHMTIMYSANIVHLDGNQGLYY